MNLGNYKVKIYTNVSIETTYHNTIHDAQEYALDHTQGLYEIWEYDEVEKSYLDIT